MTTVCLLVKMKKYSFKPKSKWREMLGEKFIALNALAALIAVLLIFIFIFKESVPIFYDEEVQQEASLDKMTFKQVYYEGREPKWSWQPNSEVPKYSLLPLFWGLLKPRL
jgi:phosphate transport system permease protein